MLMCGIVACRTVTPSLDYLTAALRRLQYRGYDSVGVAVRTTSGELARLRTVERIDSLAELASRWSGVALDGAGVGHTRWATHGAVNEENTHPHVDCTGRIALVHNGIIDNASLLRCLLIDSGHTFSSDVDSEVICHLIEDQLSRDVDLPAAVRSALDPLEGSWAIAVLDAYTGRIVVAANRSPLLVAHTDHGVFAASDIAAVAEWVDEFRVLESGDVVELTGDGLRESGRDVDHAVLAKCRWGSDELGLDGYADHMAKEIDEQPEAVSRVLDEIGGDVANGKLWKDLGLPAFDRLQVYACGTSLNAGSVLANLVHRVGGVSVGVTVASEAGEISVPPGTLSLLISQSGETADVLQVLESRTEGSAVLALTNNPFSTLARRADAFLDCSAGPEIGVAATKTFVCQVVAGAALLISALVASDRLAPVSAVRLRDALRAIPDALVAAGATAKCLVPPLGEPLARSAGFLFVSKGTGLPYAAEGALKLKELTYQWAEHYPAGELKHGPLALITDGTPVIAIDNGHPRLASSIAEVSARGARVITIGKQGSTIPVASDRPQPWGPIEAVVPMQILARTLALARGNDVDKPRNLAKSVTVE